MVDPVLERRARIATQVSTGKRIGYSLWLASIMLFFFGFFTKFSDTLTTAITACLLIGSVFLVPAILMGYAVRAANREDREQGRL